MNLIAIALIITLVVGVGIVLILYFSLINKPVKGGTEQKPVSKPPDPISICENTVENYDPPVSETACSNTNETPLKTLISNATGEDSSWVQPNCEVTDCVQFFKAVEKHCEDGCGILKPFPSSGSAADQSRWWCSAAKTMAKCQFTAYNPDFKSTAKLACSMNSCFEKKGCLGGCIV